MKKQRRLRAIYLILLLTLSAVAVPGMVFGAPSEASGASAVNRIIWNISPQQVVGHAMVPPAELLLVDDSGLLVTNYDLSTDPITLSSSAGFLTPTLLNDPALFSGGVIDLSAAGVTYFGLSNPVEITASNTTATSIPALVSFSGFDIISASHPSGSPISFLFSGQVTTIFVSIRNGGGQTASADPSLKAFFSSGGGSTKIFGQPSFNGQIDTLSINLPTMALPLGVDTLVLVLEAEYQPGGAPLLTTDTLRIPLDVLPPVALSLVPGSVRPDSVYPGVSFEMSLDVSIFGYDGMADSSALTLSLVDDLNTVVGVLYSGFPVGQVLDSTTLGYRNLPAIVDTPLTMPLGFYGVRVEYTLYSDGNALSFVDDSDSLLLLSSSDVSYVSGSLTPTSVSSGDNVFFLFDLELAGNTPVHVNVNERTFRLSSPNFTASTTLEVVNDSLGLGTNRLVSGPVFIPVDLLGDTLWASASFAYQAAGAANHLTFMTDFDNQPVIVVERALVRVIATDLIAPNTPFVNTAQEFQIRTRVANLSSTDQTSFQMGMISDGLSNFDPQMLVSGVPAGDTIDVLFDIVASSLSNVTEIFSASIVTPGVNQLFPLDAVAQAAIQAPADLSLVVLLRGLAPGGYAPLGQTFDALLNVTNQGQAAASDAVIEINTNGVYLGLPDSALVDTQIIDVSGIGRGIEFIAPDYDTSVTIDFKLVGWPLDMNTNEPARIGGPTSLQFEVAVTSLDFDLFVESISGRAGILSPHRETDLFSLELTNGATSSISDMRLDRIDLFFSDLNGQPLNVRSVIEVGNTSLLGDDLVQTRSTAADDRLTLILDDCTVGAREILRLNFRTVGKETDTRNFRIRLHANDIHSSFAGGPLQGEPVTISTPDDSGLVHIGTYSFVAGALSSSLIVKRNPFSPEIERAELRYMLPAAEDVEFRVLSLTGEEVYARNFEAGQAGAQVGENRVFWSGLNDDGAMVLNGVYVIIVTSVGSGEQARLKLAVLK